MLTQYMVRHAHTLLSLQETAIERRFDMKFRKTFNYEGDDLGERHRRLGAKLHATGMIDVGIEGWLLPADAMKLYEMAYCCPGDILELGSYHGLSASIINWACNDAGQDKQLVSIDLDPLCIELAKRQLAGQRNGGRAHFFADDAETAVRNLAAAKRRFGFAFVDHSHRYEHVAGVCQHLHRVVEIDGFALFHDFNDPRNAAADAPDYGVYQGVMDGLKPDRWEFWGIYGCTGLFRRVGLC